MATKHTEREEVLFSEPLVYTLTLERLLISNVIPMPQELPDWLGAVAALLYEALTRRKEANSAWIACTRSSWRRLKHKQEYLCQRSLELQAR